jgi:stage III sporulation protein AE
MKIKNITAIVLACVLLAVMAPSLKCSAQPLSTVTAASSASSSDYTSGANNALLQEQSSNSGAGQLQGKAPQSAQKSLDSLGIKSGDVNSLSQFTPANMLKTVMNSLQSAAEAPLKAVAAVLGILLVCALLNTLKNSFGEKSLQNVFDVVSALCIASVIIVPVSQCVSFCAQTITQSSDFMLTFLPVYTALASVSGHPASAIAFQSLLLVASEALTQIASTTFVPMVDIYLGFCVVGAVSPGVNISGIASFVKNTVTWGLGLCMTIYVGILTIQGLISNAADNVTMKAAKFVVEGAVPVIGGAISDAMNTVISCAGLLKTAVGAYAIVVFILAFLPPVLECFIWLIAADFSLAVADILGISNMSGMLKAFKEALKLLLALVLVSALAMIVSVSVMLLVGMGS